MKKSKSFKKALLPAIALLIAAIVSLTSVTYAWFTYGDFATVDQIDVNVEAAGGLQISMADASGNFSWTSNVDPNLDNSTLKPVSSAGKVTNGAMEFFTATYDDTLDKIHTISAATNPGEADEDKTKSWITFDVYFRNAEATDKVVNINETTVKSASGFSNLAVRMAFVKQGSISSTAINQNKNAFTTTFSGNADIYEPNATDHTTSGESDYMANNSSSDGTGKYAYKALTAEDTSATHYYNRYTGYLYEKVAEGTTATTVNYVYDASLTTAEKFRNWKAEDDWTAIDAQQAADILQRDNDAEIYTAMNKTNKLVGDPVPGTTYYISTPATIYSQTTAPNKLVDVTTKGDTAAETYIELGKQTVTKVTVYIWLEGQDADCDNAVAGYQFSVNLQFNATVVNN